MSSQQGRGNLSIRRHGIGGHRSRNSPGMAQTVRDINRAMADSRARRNRAQPRMYATAAEALRSR